MEPDKKPVVIDLQDHRKRKAQAAKAAHKTARPARNDGFLGGRPGAGLILALVVIVALALWLLPRLL